MLKVLNFAIYHKELTEMEEREQEREKELERKRRAECHSHRNDADDHTTADRDGSTTDAMEVDDHPPAEQATAELSLERIEAFNSAFREHMRYMDSITIDDLEKVVNTGGVPYSREEIMLLLQKLHDENKVMIADGKVHMVIS